MVQKTFNVEIKGNKNVIALIGSKEGVAHAPLAFVNPGDIALVPDPGYPVYSVATEFAGGTPYVMPLLESNGFMPDLDIIPEDILKKTKIMFLNYPNNPTSAFANDEFFKIHIIFVKCRKLSTPPNPGRSIFEKIFLFIFHFFLRQRIFSLKVIQL